MLRFVRGAIERHYAVRYNKTLMMIETFTHEKGCGLAADRDGGKCEGVRTDGLPMSIMVSRSMIYSRVFQWHADVKDAEGFVAHADGSFDEPSDSLQTAGDKIWALADALAFERGNFHRVKANY